jgi:hypothetical protein
LGSDNTEQRKFRGYWKVYTIYYKRVGIDCVEDHFSRYDNFEIWLL